MRTPAPILDTTRQDWIHLVLAPVWALALGLALGLTPLARWRITAFGLAGSPVDAFLGSFIMAHLVIVFFRSHANAEVRALHPVRFWAVPPALLILLVVSEPARTLAAALAVWWDVYHSSLQTFGLGRIFDHKAGNDPEAGRRLDWMLNLLLYVGPILGGASFVYHASPLYSLEAGAWAQALVFHQPKIRLIVIAAGLLFLVLYLETYAVLVEKGYRPPREKVALHLGTAAVSVWAWGFNPLGMALFIMNFFHAWQYFALVWRYERANIGAVLRVPKGHRGRALAFAGLVVLGFLYGTVFGVLGELSNKALAVTLVVSLMHFWYDGFIWSVRKNQV
jgi:hypothetical protein